MLFRFRTISWLALCLAGCATSPAPPKPDWVAATDVDITANVDFWWIDELSAAPSTILDNQISRALRAQLTSKGYVEAPEMPDMLVSYETLELEIVKKANPMRIGIGVGSWGGSSGGSVGSSVDVSGDDEVSYQHQIVIRVTDLRTDQEIWIGTSTTFEQTPDDATVAAAVAGVMAGFPARS
jgi:hypothetical protein